MGGDIEGSTGERSHSAFDERFIEEVKKKRIRWRKGREKREEKCCVKGFGVARPAASFSSWKLARLLAADAERVCMYICYAFLAPLFGL